ncbi:MULTISPECIES: hypothetical protein [Dickeya]|uniref:hypothetical protein n=1 Tax=Dickeya TaxID=204037 RepID=UPI000309DBB0|nr:MULTISPECIES: hypothetical protein [Dickeya]AJC68376.1 hypothetical protein W909_06705 [Dickeya zeae EC1]
MDGMVQQEYRGFRLSVRVLIHVAIELVIFFCIFFLVGSGDGKSTYFIVFSVFFPLVAIFSISVELMLDALGRVSLGASSELCSEAVLYSKSSYSTTQRPAQLWSKLALGTGLLSLIVTIVTYVISGFSMFIYKEIPLMAMGSLFLGVTLSVLMMYLYCLPALLQWYQRTVFSEKNNAGKTFSDEHLVMNYFIPWVIVTMLAVGFISWGYYHQQVDLDVESVAFGCGGTAWIISLWITHVTQKQAVIDVRAGLLHFDDDDELDEWSLYFILHAFSAAVVSAIFIIVKYLPFNILNEFSVVVLDIFVAMISAIVGVIMGVLRGRTIVLSKK